MGCHAADRVFQQPALYLPKPFPFPGIILAYAVSMIIFLMMLCLGVFTVTGTVWADPLPHSDRFVVKSVHTIRDGRLVNSRLVFEESTRQGQPCVEIIQITGTSFLEPGESMDEIERRAVLNGLSELFDARREKSAYLFQRSWIQGHAVAGDEVVVEEAVRLCAGLTILERTLDQETMRVHLRAPVVWESGQEPDGPILEDCLRKAAQDLSKGLMNLRYARIAAARNARGWMDRLGASLRRTLP